MVASFFIIGAWSQRLVMAPFVSAMELSGPIYPTEILTANRSIEQQGDSRVVKVSFRHPDPVMAARVANLIMDEYIHYNLSEEIDSYMRMAEDLGKRLDVADERINELSIHYEGLKAETEKTTTGDSPDTFNTELEISKQALIAEITFRTKLYGAMREAQTRFNILPHATILDQPFPPLHPDSPNVVQLLSISLGGAFTLSIGFFVLTPDHGKRLLRL